MLTLPCFFRLLYDSMRFASRKFQWIDFASYASTPPPFLFILLQKVLILIEVYVYETYSRSTLFCTSGFYMFFFQYEDCNNIRHTRFCRAENYLLYELRIDSPEYLYMIKKNGIKMTRSL